MCCARIHQTLLTAVVDLVDLEGLELQLIKLALESAHDLFSGVIGSSRGLDVVALVVKDLSIVLACSSSSFIVEPSEVTSSSFGFELEEEASSPSAFWILGF